MSSSSLQITWTPPSKENIRGRLLGYRLHYQRILPNNPEKNGPTKGTAGSPGGATGGGGGIVVNMLSN